MTAITVSQLTNATLEGTGVFDVLMKANKAHLDAEFDKNRIKGAEYSTVYLGSLTQVMQTALQFLLTKDKAGLEADLLTKQIALAEIEIDKANATLTQIQAQTALINQQRTNLIAEASNIPKQGALLDAQKDVQVAAKLQTEAETLNVPKQGELIDAQKDSQIASKLQVEAQTLLVGQQRTNLIAEASNIPKQGVLLDKQALDVIAKTELTTQQKTNLIAEASNIPKQGVLLDKQALDVVAKTELVVQQKTNAITENTVLVAQECKLRAEYDLTMGTTLKAAQETALLTQKIVTERAQVTSMGVDADSVVGRQKALYVAQTTGFTRDAEQKAAKLMVDSWNVRRTTDEATVADGTNKLNDLNVGKAVQKLLDGVGA